MLTQINPKCTASHDSEAKLRKLKGGNLRQEHHSQTTNTTNGEKWTQTKSIPL